MNESMLCSPSASPSTLERLNEILKFVDHMKFLVWTLTVLSVSSKPELRTAPTFIIARWYPDESGRLALSNRS